VRRTPAATAKVRDELAHVPITRTCDRRAELAALLRAAGMLQLSGNGRLAVEVEVGDAVVARRVVSAMHDAFGGARARILEPGRRRPRPRLVVRADDIERTTLHRMKAIDVNGRPRVGIDSSLVARRCCAAAYLRGAFLARGSVGAPQADAHLEVRAGDERTGRDIASLLLRVGCHARLRRHRGAWTAYVKDAESVGRALTVMGSHRAYLAREEASVWKAVRGRAARLANADAANARRIARSSVAQLAAIESLAEDVGLDALSPVLREIVTLRLLHPDASIEDLGRLCLPPISKGAAAGRLRRIEEIAHGARG
jgi:cell division protein WhiA